MFLGHTASALLGAIIALNVMQHVLGAIDHNAVQQTGSGLQQTGSSGLKTTKTIQAEAFQFNLGCRSYGGAVDSTDDGDYVGYSQVDFGDGVNTITHGLQLTYKCCAKTTDKGFVDVYIKTIMSGEDPYRLATFGITDTGNTYISNALPFNKQVTGKQDLYLKFRKDDVGADAFNYYVAIVDNIAFY